MPADTDPTATLYLSGSAPALGSWKPDGLALTRAADHYSGRISVPPDAPIEFKVTRGAWNSVEKRANGEEIPNRSFTPSAGLVVNVQVAAWSTRPSATRRASTLTGDIRRHDNFKSDLLQNQRTIWVYLPPDYHTDPARRFPVLYLHDGQNVFDAATSFAGEWRADETAERLIRDKRIEPVIIVAVANTPRRMDEYTPAASNNRGGHGDDYAHFLIEELKPFIDRAYRTRPGRDSTAVAGSSLGGLISLHIGRKYADQVSMIGALSPSLWWDDRRMLRDIEADGAALKQTRIWLDIGTAEGSSQSASRFIEDGRRLAALFEKAGIVAEKSLAFREIQHAAHNESAWAARFDQVLLFFFGIDAQAAAAFPISFWCGSPADFVTPEHYQRIADAGFTHIMPACSGGSSPAINKKILDIAQKAGLKAFLSDGRIPSSLAGDAARRAAVHAVAADYSAHPAFAGYFLTDEPAAGAFPGLAEVVKQLREADPAHPAYINLFPNYATAAQLGARTYDEYLESFLKTVKPQVLSYDHYHFLKNSDRPGFFANLASARKAALAHNVPFWQIVLATEHLGYRLPTEAEKRYLAMLTLAYGGKGLMYFTYWQPAADGNWGTSIINFDGTPTKQYDEIKRINRDVQMIGRQLLGSVSESVHDYGTPGDVLHTGSAPPIRVHAPEFTIGRFRDGETRYAMVVNRDYRNAISTTIAIPTEGKPLHRLDRMSQTWIKIPDAPYQPVALSLAPGDADLFKW